jgi:hypothetical protein
LFGALPRAIGVVQLAILAASLLVVWNGFARSRRTDEDLLLGVAATIAAALVFNKVLSPQYLIWLVPPLALLDRRARAIAWPLSGVAMLLTLAYFPNHFGDVTRVGSTVWVVFLRDLLLATLALYLIRVSYLSGRTRAPGSARSGMSA